MTETVEPEVVQAPPAPCEQCRGTEGLMMLAAVCALLLIAGMAFAYFYNHDHRHEDGAA